MAFPNVNLNSSNRFPSIGASSSLNQETEVRNLLLSQIYGRVVPPMSKPPLSGNAIGAGYVVSDWLMLGRALDDLSTLELQNRPNPVAQEILTILGGSDIALLYQLSGLATAVNAIGWAANLPNNLKSIAHSKALDDHRAVLKGRLTFAQNVLGTGAGLMIGGGFRISSILSNIKGVSTSGFSAPTLLGRVTYGCLFAGLVLFSIVNTLLSVALGISIYEGEKLKRNLKDCKSLNEITEVLQKKLTVDPATLSEKLKKQYGEQGYIKALAREAISLGTQGLKSMLDELGIKGVEQKKLEEIFTGLVGDHFGLEAGTLAYGYKQKFEAALALIGFDMKLRKLELKKQEKLTRVLGADLITKIRSGKLELGEVESALSKNLRTNLIIIAIMTLSTLAMVAAIVFTGGLGLVVGAALMVLSSLSMLAVDHYFFKKSIESEQPAPHDKKMLALSMMISVASVVTVVALHVLGIVSMGIVPLAVMLVLTGIWLGYNAYTWHALNEKERTMNEKKPSLDYFLKIASGKDEEKTRQLFRRLPFDLQQMIRDEKKPYAEATRAVIQRFEDDKQRFAEKLREAIRPYLIK